MPAKGFRFFNDWLPIAAVTNYHKRSGLENHEFTLIYFWRSEVSAESHSGKTKVLTRLLLLEALRGESVLFPLSA